VAISSQYVQKCKGIQNSTVSHISNKIQILIPGSFYGREIEWNEITDKLHFTAKELITDKLNFTSKDLVSDKLNFTYKEFCI
jgi:hypothetical protein